MFVFILVRIGMWSDDSAVTVFHVVFWYKLLAIVVISGDVCCWFAFVGMRVGVLELRIMCVEFSSMSVMMFPLWSCTGENQWSE